MIGYMATRHKGDSPFQKTTHATGPTAIMRRRKVAQRRGCNSGRATPSLRYSPAAKSHPDWRWISSWLSPRITACYPGPPCLRRHLLRCSPHRHGVEHSLSFGPSPAGRL